MRLVWLLLLLAACSPQVQIVDRVVERVVEVPVERLVVQCFDGSIRSSQGDCPSPLTASVVHEPREVATVQDLIDDAPTNYWFAEEDGFEFVVAGDLRRSGEVVWDVAARRAWVFIGEVDRKWYVQHVGIAPAMSGWVLPAYLELNVTFDRAFDRAILPRFSKTNLVWQRMQPIYVGGPVDVLARFLGVQPKKVETASQSLRVMKKDISSNLSLHFVDGNVTTVLKVDAYHGVPFVVEEFVDFHRVSRRSFLFSEYARDGQETVAIDEGRAGLPADAVVLSVAQWEGYREFQDGTS